MCLWFSGCLSSKGLVPGDLLAKAFKVTGFSWTFGVIDKMCVWFHSHKADGVIPYQFWLLPGLPKDVFELYFSLLLYYPENLSVEINDTFNWSTTYLLLKIKTALKCLLITIRLNSLWPSDAIWRQICFNIGSGNGLLPDSTKPLHEPMLIYHHWGPKAFTWKKFHERCPNHQSLKWIWKPFN